jgi:hypothetical protein
MVMHMNDQKFPGRRRSFCWLAWLMLAILPVSAYADVHLELDRQRMVEGETVTLTFVTDDPSQSLDADFSQLEQDFQIIDRRSETQLSLVNGRQTAVVRLLLTVEPRRVGELQIPAFDFGDSSTRPVTLVVEAAPELKPGELPPVFIEVELSPPQGPWYVHAQFGLVVRVFYQQNLTEAAISQPDPTPASVRLLQETPYQAERGGERYRVLERNYAIFPERSGELVIPAMELTGRLVERRSGSNWQPQVRGRRIRTSSEPLTLQIEPRPASYTGDEWLPARELDLSQQVSSGDTLRVGEPVTRTVLVDAVGLEENMLVEPAWPAMENARVYPDQPQGITRDDGRWVLGHKEFRYAVVPEQPGELVLPEMKLDWWDTVNQLQRTAVLPAHVLQVEPSALAPPPQSVAPADSAAPAQTASASNMPSDGSAYWKGLSLLFAALWAATLLLAAWLWSRSGPRAAAEGLDVIRAPGEEELLKELKRACMSNDRKALRKALRRWLRKFGPSQDGSLLAFAGEAGDSSLAQQLVAVDADGFSPGSKTDWDGAAFWRTFEQWRKDRLQAAKDQHESLTDLYAPAHRRD